MVTAVDRLLTANVPVLDEHTRRAGAAVEILASDPAITRVYQLSARTGTSTRSLQRLFREYVGVSPE